MPEKYQFWPKEVIAIGIAIGIIASLLCQAISQDKSHTTLNLSLEVRFLRPAVPFGQSNMDDENSCHRKTVVKVEPYSRLPTPTVVKSQKLTFPPPFFYGQCIEKVATNTI